MNLKTSLKPIFMLGKLIQIQNIKKSIKLIMVVQDKRNPRMYYVKNQEIQLNKIKLILNHQYHSKYKVI